MKFVKPPDRPTVNILIYGPPKSGKTIGAATAPGGVLYLNADLPNATRQAHLRNQDGRIMEPELPRFEEGKLGMMELLATIANEISEPDQKVIDSVVVDPLGELYRRMLEDVSTRAIRPSLPQYGDVSTHLERFCRFLCEAPVTTVLVAHELTQKDEAVGEFLRIPFTGTKAGSETAGAKLSGMVDIIAYTGVLERADGTKEYLAQLVPAKGRNAGDRFACLGDFRPLNIAEWIDCIAEYERTGVAPPPPQSTPAGAEQTDKQPVQA